MTDLPEGIRAEFRRALERERDRLLESIAFLTEAQRILAESQAAEGSVGGTEADIATDVNAQTLEASLGNAERERLAEVEEALERLKDGRYGRCVDCGGPIELERLQVLPWTPFCVHCALRRAGSDVRKISTA